MLLARKSAGTRIHGTDQHESRRERRRSGRARDDHAALLERLTEQIERVSMELEDLVEKEHSVMRETHFAGARLRPASNEGRVRRRVMGRAKRTVGDQTCAGRQQPGHRVHRSDLQRFVERQGRENARHPPRHHRLSGSRRANEQEVVTTGGRHLERTTSEELAAHVRKVG
jgi:hypothetical protein